MLDDLESFEELAVGMAACDGNCEVEFKSPRGVPSRGILAALRYLAFEFVSIF